MALNDEASFVTDNERNLSTLQSDWTTIGIIDAAAAAADGALGTTERTFTDGDALDNAVSIQDIPASWNSIEVQFEAATNEHNGITDVYLGRKGSDVARRICTITWITGTQQGDGSGLELIQSMAVTNEKWYSAIANITGTDTDRIAGVLFDLHGYNKIMFHGHTTFDGDLTVKVAGT